jgi:hypothetical protein
MQSNEAFLNQLIRNHYKAAQEMTLLMVIHLVLGAATFIVLPDMIEAERFKDLAGTLGGVFFGGLGLNAGKEVLSRREKARDLEATQFLLLQALNPEATSLMDEAEKQRLKEQFLQLFEKTLLE